LIDYNSPHYWYMVALYSLWRI